LKAGNTFTEIKGELDKKLCSAGKYLPGSRVILDVGNRTLSNKQVREIEDMLLDYGLYLKGLIPRNLSSTVRDTGKYGHLLDGGIPYYKETVLICRHLRSGQKIFGEGNIVILGDVNPGAEVIAGGNILVMGALKGMAHAGVFGDENVVISAYRLTPTQLRIANHITRPPDGEEVTTNCPEIARIRAGKVIIEKLKV